MYAYLLKIRVLLKITFNAVLFTLLIIPHRSWSQLYGEYSFMEKNVNISQLRIEHVYQPWDGEWRNITFIENSTTRVKNTHNQNLGDVSDFLGGHEPISSNFWLVAEIIATGEFVQCSYGTDSVFFDYDEGFDRVDPARQKHFQSARSPTFDWFELAESIGDPWSRYEISKTRMGTWRGTVPEGDSIRIYFGADLFQVCGRGDPILAVGTADPGKVWHGWDDYFGDGGFNRGAWAVSDPFFIEDPQPPDTLDPPPGEVHFVKYLKKTAAGGTVDGKNWLPDPTTHDSLIGIEFSVTDADSETTNGIIYEVFEVSQWLGQDMNHPVESIDGEPVRDDSLWFDFHVYNPMYGNDPKYTVTTISIDRYDPYLENQSGQLGQYLSTRSYTVERNEPVEGDTLWLIARDYAAHAVIIPRGVSTHTLRLRKHVSPFDSSALWAVTVPRDYDGWQDVGMNKGDFMADRWEEVVLNVPYSDSALTAFNPFYNRNSLGQFEAGIYADDDSLPTGRDIDGDRFVNWVEYRGFHVTGDIDSVEFAAPKHVRLLPEKKTVMIDWQISTLHHDIADNIPGWLNLLESTVYDTLEMYFVDAHLDTSDRFRASRLINPNTRGAYFFYYGVPCVTNWPDPLTQNAVSWWEVNDDEKDFFEIQMNMSLDSSGYQGLTVFIGPGDYCVPKLHRRCWVYLPEMDRWQTSTYYLNNPGQWQQDYYDMIKLVISHEFGHSIGMDEGNNNEIMNDPAPINLIPGNNFGRFFYPIFTQDYSDSSRNELSTRHTP